MVIISQGVTKRTWKSKRRTRPKSKHQEMETVAPDQELHASRNQIRSNVAVVIKGWTIDSEVFRVRTFPSVDRCESPRRKSGRRGSG